MKYRNNNIYIYIYITDNVQFYKSARKTNYVSCATTDAVLPNNHIQE